MQALKKLTAKTIEHLQALILDRYGSHVARSFLCLLAGRDVIPAQGKPGSGASSIQVVSHRLCIKAVGFSIQNPEACCFQSSLN